MGSVDEDEFRRLWLDNASLLVIARRFRIGRPKVNALARYLRLPRRDRKPQIPTEDTDDILDAGLTPTQIAERYGVSRNWATVWRMRRLRERAAEPALDVPADEVAASEDDLRLAPWVAERAAEFADKRAEADGRFRTVGGMLVW